MASDYVLPLPIIPGYYTDRIALTTGTLVPGQVFQQADDAIDAFGSPVPRGYYTWDGVAWVVADAASGGEDLDGRGTNFGMGGAYRVNNLATKTTAIMANVSASVGAIFGLWDRAIGAIGAIYGQYVNPFLFLVYWVGKMGQGFQWYSFNPLTLRNTKMLQVVHNTDGVSQKVQVAMNFGADLEDGLGSAYGQPVITPSDGVNLTETTNSTNPQTVSIYTIPVHSLVSGMGMKFRAFGVTGAGTGNHTLALQIGGVTVVTSPTFSGATSANIGWVIDGEIYRVSATQFKYSFTVMAHGQTVGVGQGTGTLVSGDWTTTQTAAVVLTAAVGDLSIKGMRAEVFN